MSSLPSREIERALLKKGFQKENSKDRLFTLYVAGKKTAVRTLLSHTSNMDYGDSLLSAMARQMRFGKKELLAFVECTLSEDAYVDLLRNSGVDVGGEPKQPQRR